MKIFITGAHGQLAKEFQTYFAKDGGHEVTAADKEKLDITDPDAVSRFVSSLKPALVFNCAAYNHVDNAEKEEDAAFQINAEGARHLALSCKRTGALIVHYSSDYVFSGTKEDFYTEEDTPNPINAYGRSKLSGETLLQEVTDNFLIFRTSWVFGEGDQNFLRKLREWAERRKVLKIISDQISVPTFTEDIVKYSMLAVGKGLRGVYHLTNSGYATRYELARYFLAKLSKDTLVLPADSGQFPTPAQRPFFSAMSNKKLSAALDVQIPDWKDAVDRFVERQKRQMAKG